MAFMGKLRLFLVGLAAGVVGLYLYGLFLGIYAPLELGLLSIVSMGLIVVFVVHEVRLRRDMKTREGHIAHAREQHTAKERRGF